MTRNKLFFLLALSFISGIVNAQDSLKVHQDQMNTLLTLPRISTLGIYFAPEYQYGRVAGQFTSLGGGSFMVTLNKRLGVGVGGYTTFHPYAPNEINSTSPQQFNAHYYGARLEYTLFPNSKVHVSFPLLIGGGQANIDSTGNHFEGYRRGPHHGYPSGNSMSFLVVQPGINIETNVFRFMKVFAGASYRIVSGGESHTTNLSVESPTLGQLQGLSFSAGIKIGYDFYLHSKKH